MNHNLRNTCSHWSVKENRIKHLLWLWCSFFSVLLCIQFASWKPLSPGYQLFWQPGHSHTIVECAVGQKSHAKVRLWDIIWISLNLLIKVTGTSQHTVKHDRHHKTLTTGGSEVCSLPFSLTTPINSSSSILGYTTKYWQIIKEVIHTVMANVDIMSEWFSFLKRPKRCEWCIIILQWGIIWFHDPTDTY